MQSARYIVFVGAVRFFSQFAVAQDRASADHDSSKTLVAILQELRSIRVVIDKAVQGQGLTQITTPQDVRGRSTVEVKTEGLQAIGSPNAPATIVEFFDYQCPYCRAFQLSIFSRLREKYIDTGKLRFISFDFPLSTHPNAVGAAEAVYCAGDQKQFWEARQELSLNPENLNDPDLIKHMSKLNLDTERWKDCFESGKYREKVASILRQAQAVGISVTPSFLIGRTIGGTTKGHLILGSQPLEVFEAAIADLNH